MCRSRDDRVSLCGFDRRGLRFIYGGLQLRFLLVCREFEAFLRPGQRSGLLGSIRRDRATLLEVRAICCTLARRPNSPIRLW